MASAAVHHPGSCTQRVPRLHPSSPQTRSRCRRRPEARQYNYRRRKSGSHGKISSFPVYSLALRLEASFVLLYRFTVRKERRVPHKCTWRSQHCPLSGSIWLLWRRDLEEALYMFILFGELAKVIKIQYKQQVKLVDYTQYIKESVVPDAEDTVMSHSQ